MMAARCAPSTVAHHRASSTHQTHLPPPCRRPPRTQHGQFGVRRPASPFPAPSTPLHSPHAASHHSVNASSGGGPTSYASVGMAVLLTLHTGPVDAVALEQDTSYAFVCLRRLSAMSNRYPHQDYDGPPAAAATPASHLSTIPAASHRRMCALSVVSTRRLPALDAVIPQEQCALPSFFSASRVAPQYLQVCAEVAHRFRIRSTVPGRVANDTPRWAPTAVKTVRVCIQGPRSKQSTQHAHQTGTATSAAPRVSSRSLRVQNALRPWRRGESRRCFLGRNSFSNVLA